MNKNFYKNRKMRFFSFTFAFLISIGLIIQSCSMEEDEPLLLDDAILNSSELEEYIIAGAEYNNALTNFTNELSKIDFSTLNVTYDADGRKVVHLPVTFIEDIKFSEKERSLYEKKEAFLKKIPQFSSFSEDLGKRYFQQCVQYSVKVKTEFLKLGINTVRPKLKSGNEINIDENFSYLMWQMYNWTNNPNYVEVYLVGYADGTYEVVQMPGASPSIGGDPFLYNIVNNTTMYYPPYPYGKIVTSIGHTHIKTSEPTKSYWYQGVFYQADYFPVPSTVSRYIYYGGGIHYY